MTFAVLVASASAFAGDPAQPPSCAEALARPSDSGQPRRLPPECARAIPENRTQLPPDVARRLAERQRAAARRALETTLSGSSVLRAGTASESAEPGTKTPRPSSRVVVAAASSRAEATVPPVAPPPGPSDAVAVLSGLWARVAAQWRGLDAAGRERRDARSRLQDGTWATAWRTGSLGETIDAATRAQTWRDLWNHRAAELAEARGAVQAVLDRPDVAAAAVLHGVADDAVTVATLNTRLARWPTRSDLVQTAGVAATYLIPARAVGLLAKGARAARAARALDRLSVRASAATRAYAYEGDRALAGLSAAARPWAIPRELQAGPTRLAAARALPASRAATAVTPPDPRLALTGAALAGATWATIMMRGGHSRGADAPAAEDDVARRGGDCGSEEHRRLQNDIDESCKDGRAKKCPGLENLRATLPCACGLWFRQEMRNRRCADARSRLQQKCFGGGQATADERSSRWGHFQTMAEAAAGATQCQALYERNGCGRQPAASCEGLP